MPTRPIRILSIDGGGFRGVIPATIIKEFERISGKPMKDMFDVFIGTSTGAILATSLVAPTNPGQQTNRFGLAQTLESYKKNGPKIFKEKPLYKRSDAELMTRIGPLHEIDVLLEILHGQLGDLRMGDALKRLMVTAYDLPSRTLKVFDSNNTNRQMYKTAASSAAAPTFFAPVHLDIEGGSELVLTDGGVGLSNPALYAVTKLLGEGISLDRIRVVSLGTGQAAAEAYNPKIEKWGPVRWVTQDAYILNVFMDAMAEATDIHLKAMLDSRYHRLQVEMRSDDIHLDDGSVEYFNTLSAAARSWIDHNETALNNAITAVNL